MITIATRDYNVVCQLQFEGDSGLIAYDDSFEQPEDSDLSTYSFRVDKTSKEIEAIKIGQLAYVKDGDTMRVFEIMRLESDSDTLRVHCVDGGLDFVNGEQGEMTADDSYPISHYVDLIRGDSGWAIGVNQMPESVTRKLSYEGKESSVTRLKRVATAFDAEIEYSFELDNTRVLRRLINIYPKGANRKHVRLEYGLEVSKIEKSESIEKLVTALEAVGEEGLTLKGYEVPAADSNEWRITDTGALVHLPSTRQWSRYGKGDRGFILGYYESEAKTQKTLYDAVKNQVLKRCFPEVTYTVDVEMMPEPLRRGDYAIVVDHDYMPPLAIEGRVTATSGISFADSSYGTITISNVDVLEYTEDDAIRRLSEQMRKNTYNWNNAPYVVEVTSSNGDVFQNGNVETTLTATVYKNNVDVTSEFSRFTWRRFSMYDTSGDAAWDKAHNQNSRYLRITSDDVDNAATFAVEVAIDITGRDNSPLIVNIDKSSIVIKDLTFQTATGPTAPKNPETGMVWIDTSSGKDVRKIYLDKQWVKVVNEQDVSNLRSEYDDKLFLNKAEIGRIKNNLYNDVGYVKSDVSDLKQQSRALSNQVARDKQATDSKLSSLENRTNTISNQVNSKADKSTTEAALSKLDKQASDLTNQLNGKADFNITETQLRILREQQAILRQEMAARASLEELKRWEEAYQKFTEQAASDKRASESALLLQSQRVAELTRNYGAFKEQLNFLTTYTTFSEEGVTIGKKDGSSQMRISQDRISMYSAGKEVMYISQGVIHIDNGVFTKSLQIGHYVESQYESNEHYNVIRYVV